MSLKQLYARATVGPTGCREWDLSKNQHGYGKAANGNGGWILAHRAAWLASGRELDAGLVLCHRCDNPACINVDHLFVGTQADNVADCNRKARARGAKGERNGRAKLTAEDVRAIRASSESAAAAALRYSVSRAMICRIRRLAAWQHVA